MRISLRTFVFYLVIICLGLPLSVFNLGNLDIPLGILIFFVSLPYFLISKAHHEKLLFIIVILVLFTVVPLKMLVHKSYSLRPFFSLIYFLISYFSYFVGYSIIQNEKELEKFIRILSLVFSLFVIVVFGDLILNGKNVRLLGSLNGTFLGLLPYGTYGVNSLAVYYVLMMITISIHLYFRQKIKIRRIILFAPIQFCLFYIIFGSLSREALLGTMGFIFLTFAHLVKKSKRNAILFLSALLVIMCFVIIQFGEYFYESWFYKNEVTMLALAENDYDNFSSGRISLYKSAIETILDYPLFGTGFQGFDLKASDTIGNSDTKTQNSSIHNQFLTALWKMGILPSFFYFFFLWRTFLPVYKMQKRNPETQIYAGIFNMVLVYYFIFCQLWDVLLVPQLGIFFMVILGAVSRINANQIGKYRLKPNRKEYIIHECSQNPFSRVCY